MPYLQWFSTEDTRGVLNSLILSTDFGSLGAPRVLQAELLPLKYSSFFLLKQGNLHFPLLDKNQESWQTRSLENAAVWVCKGEIRECKKNY